MEDKINIGGIEYKLGYNLRVRMIYEKLIGKPIGVEMLTFENIVYFFSVLIAFNKETFKMELETFTDYLNDNEDVYNKLLEWFINYWKQRSVLSDTDMPECDEDKKKA